MYVNYECMSVYMHGCMSVCLSFSLLLYVNDDNGFYHPHKYLHKYKHTYIHTDDERVSVFAYFVLVSVRRGFYISN